jgi:hypothetical protein
MDFAANLDTARGPAPPAEEKRPTPIQATHAQVTLPYLFYPPAQDDWGQSLSKTAKGMYRFQLRCDRNSDPATDLEHSRHSRRSPIDQFTHRSICHLFRQSTSVFLTIHEAAPIISIRHLFRQVYIRHPPAPRGNTDRVSKYPTPTIIRNPRAKPIFLPTDPILVPTTTATTSSHVSGEQLHQKSLLSNRADLRSDRLSKHTRAFDASLSSFYRSDLLTYLFTGLDTTRPHLSRSISTCSPYFSLDIFDPIFSPTVTHLVLPRALSDLFVLPYFHGLLPTIAVAYKYIDIFFQYKQPLAVSPPTQFPFDLSSPN